MHIQIKNTDCSEDLKRTIYALETNKEFEEEVVRLRLKYNIPIDGLNDDSLEFTKDFIKDDLGHKVKLTKPFIDTGNEDVEYYFYDFLDNPLVFISDNPDVQSDIEALLVRLKLNHKWYCAISFIVLASVVKGIPAPIKIEVKERDAPESSLDSSGVAIRITEKVSKKELLNWINKNWSRVQQNLMSIKDVEPIVFNPDQEAIDIMREAETLLKNGKTYLQTWTELVNKYPDNDSSYLQDENNLKAYYHRISKLPGFQKVTKKRHNP
ncbi:MAG: hypothetical protein ACOX6N_04475 [Patescibacteria group bacterium]|jgi:hypothetical protein